MCSKHVEAWNKTYCETNFGASSWLNAEINILRCTVRKTSKKNLLKVRQKSSNLHKRHLKVFSHNCFAAGNSLCLILCSPFKIATIHKVRRFYAIILRKRLWIVYIRGKRRMYLLSQFVELQASNALSVTRQPNTFFSLLGKDMHFMNQMAVCWWD